MFFALGTIAKRWGQLKCRSADEWVNNIIKYRILISHKKEQNFVYTTTQIDLGNIILVK